ncbi:MAG: glycosyltransferase [Candidatus Omnitrophica bacterium]|nr:glycosyltransferase [Candidatus Omnitrophota bacterium]
MNDKLILVGDSDIIHIGSHLLDSAKELGLDVRFCDVKDAFAGPRWLSRINWYLRDHRPNRLCYFSNIVLKVCQEFQPKWLLSVGLAPVNSSALAAIVKLGIKRLNYLTDDPWNPAHRARFFFSALPHYDRIFSTRLSNLDELKNKCRGNVSYLPFAYNPNLHFPQKPDEKEGREYECDVAFVGGADRDRVGYIYRLIHAGFRVSLYGGYWDRFSETRKYARGHIGPETMRKAVSAAKINLCLVRRANQDGNSMRTFEIPAMGGCMLAEDTAEHKKIFGGEGEAVAYFKNIDEMIQKARFLIANETERNRLAEKCHNLIVGGGNTYKDRFLTILKSVES